jgi:hypothetical protein
MINIASNGSVNQNKNILISYEGDINDHLLDRILKLSEYKLNRSESNLRVKKKVFKIVVEMIQNIYNHYTKFAAKSNENLLRMVKFTIDKQNNVYTIRTGNHISAQNVALLKNKIDQLNAMTPTDLKSAYIKQLSDGTITRYGGAGLGMIDIVKNSENKLLYTFEPINEGNAFFSLWTTVSG